MVTILTESGEHAVAGAEASGEALCHGPTCVPIPAGREHELLRDGRINLAALWRHLGQPVLHSDRGDVWVLAQSAGERAAALASLDAPDFALPDLSGRVHRLSEYRGRKVLLVTWASW